MSVPSGSVRRQRPPFAMVPEALLDAGLSARAVQLYALLDRYAGPNEKAWPSRATMADRLSCSIDSVDRAVKELEENGWLSVERRVKRPGQTNEPNLYTLLERPRTPGRTVAASPSRVGADSLAAPVRPERESMNDRSAKQKTESGEDLAVNRSHVAGEEPTAREIQVELEEDRKQAVPMPPGFRDVVPKDQT